MNGLEIREQIDHNNARIEELTAKGLFILNHEIQRLHESNAHFQSLCAHEYNSQGYCIYCDKEKEE